MKKLSYLLISLVGLIFLSSAYAYNTNNIKIGVVNIQSVIKDSPKVAQIKEKLKKQFHPQEEKIVAKQKALNTMMEKIKRDSTVMRDNDKQKLNNQISTEKKELRALINDFDKKVRAAQQEEMQQLIKEITDTIAKIAKKNKLDLVIQKAALMYASDKLDITAQVKSELK